jgi:hypothetical protein
LHGHPPWGKARLLTWLAPLLRHAWVPDLRLLEFRGWPAEAAAFLRSCDQLAGPGRLFAVRSAAWTEDSATESLAGRYETLLNVPRTQLEGAIGAVIAGMPGHAGDALFVQRMIDPVIVAGVASTHRLADGAPWYCVEMAPHDCAAVTGGRASGRQYCVARAAMQDGEVWASMPAPARLALLALREVEALLGGVPSEIEFAVTAGDGGQLRACLLQARRITLVDRWSKDCTPSQWPSLDDLGRPDPLPAVHGRRTLLSLMSDWNPAELLGVHPRPLSTAMFQDLIGDGVWWEARSRLGYAACPVPRLPLIRPVLGRPMVDLRRSANSLLPAGLSAGLSARIVDGWIDTLEHRPELHDKVEFDVFRTARDFRPAAAVRSSSAFLADAQVLLWEQELTRLTGDIMSMATGGAVATQLAVLQRLVGEDVSGGWAPLLERCRAGTLAFSVLARVAFIGEAQLRSAVARGALTRPRAQQLRATARATQFDIAGASELLRSMPGSGHLRPSTFDITQSTWDESGIGAAGMAAPLPAGAGFCLSGAEANDLAALLAESGLPGDAAGWVRFVQFGASMRETAKLVFSRHLQAAMVQIERVAGAAGVDREGVSWLTLAQLRAGESLSLAGRSRDWQRCIEAARLQHGRDARAVMSPLLSGPIDRFVADSFGSIPNFVGQERATGPLSVLGPTSLPHPALKGAIVAVSSADPGYDWIFQHGIAGLITAWGGANSHLAIRCAEHGLAAAIGCGEIVFAQASQATHASIDPVSRGVWLT